MYMIEDTERCKRRKSLISIMSGKRKIKLSINCLLLLQKFMSIRLILLAKRILQLCVILLISLSNFVNSVSKLLLKFSLKFSKELMLRRKCWNSGQGFMRIVCGIQSIRYLLRLRILHRRSSMKRSLKSLKNCFAFTKFVNKRVQSKRAIQKVDSIELCV